MTLSQCVSSTSWLVEGLLLAEYSPALDDLFELGHDLVCWRNHGELKRLTQHYLSILARREESPNKAGREFAATTIKTGCEA